MPPAVVDGRVQRDANGKEMRFPIILSLAEKIIARKLVLAFKYPMCGFDLLRTQAATAQSHAARLAGGGAAAGGASAAGGAAAAGGADNCRLALADDFRSE